MALSANDFTTEPGTGTDQIVYSTNTTLSSQDEAQANQTALVDYNVQGVYHTEPLFIVGNENIQGFENYKQYDQYSGHAIKSSTPKLYDDSSNSDNNSGYTINQYKVEEKGKRFMSGKTYYLGYEVIIVAKVKSNSSNSDSSSSDNSSSS